MTIFILKTNKTILAHHLPYCILKNILAYSTNSISENKEIIITIDELVNLDDLAILIILTVISYFQIRFNL